MGVSFWNSVIGCWFWGNGVAVDDDTHPVTLDAILLNPDQGVTADEINPRVSAHKDPQSHFEWIGGIGLKSAIGTKGQKPTFNPFGIIWGTGTNAMRLSCCLYHRPQIRTAGLIHQV